MPYTTPPKTVSPGEQFGSKTVIREVPTTGRSRNRKFLCRCACGAEGVVQLATLREAFDGCRACRVGAPGVPRPGRRKFQQVGNLTSTHWNNVLHGADLRGVEVAITLEYAWGVFQAQEGRCALTGLELSIAPGRSRRSAEETTASLDRIDSALGYVEGNVQWVHKAVNKMKHRMESERFIELCNLVARHHPR